MSRVLGASSSGESGRRFVVEDVDPRAAEVPAAQRVGDGRLVDDAAASHVEDDRPRLHLGDRRLADQALRAARQRHVHGHDVRAAQQLVEVDELDAVVGGLVRGDERVDRRGPASPSPAPARAMAWPILPSPMIPSVRPRSSRPVNAERFHSPRRTDASAAAIRRASPYSSASVCSAAAMVLPVGALTTVMPGPRRSIEVDVVHADAGPADDHETGARGDELGVDLDLASDDERVVLGQDRAQLVVREARPLVDVMLGPEELDALGGDGFGDQDPHALAPAVLWLASPRASTAAA